MTTDLNPWIDLMDEIMDYLAKHPFAADTAEGIALWWMKRQRYEASIKLVGLALEELTSRGLLEKTLLSDGAFLYCLSPPQNFPESLQ